MLIVKLRSQVKVRLGSAKGSRIIPELNLDENSIIKLHRLEFGNFLESLTLMQFKC